jgi:MoaE-MoaD fusion protein
LEVQVKVLFFGQLREIVGRSQELLEVPEGSELRGVFESYARQFPRIGELAGSIVMARNHQFSSPGTPVAAGDEIAFLPPVSGGKDAFTHLISDDATGNFFALTRDPIDAAAIKHRLLRPEDGAIVDFEGVVRDNTKGRMTKYLDYECYEEMAVKMMA